MRVRSGVIALSCLLATGCYSGIDSTGESKFRGLNGNDVEINGTASNGIFLQGTFLQGTFLQGTFLQGTFLQGTFLQGIFLQGTFLQGIFLQGTFLQGETLHGMNLTNGELSATLTVDGQELQMHGTDFIGAQLNFEFSRDVDGEVITQPISMRIDDIAPSANNPDVLEYTIQLQDPETLQWAPLCIDTEGEPAPAVPINGIWDPETGDRSEDEHGITFACPDGALGKCVSWGYVPWETSEVCKKKKVWTWDWWKWKWKSKKIVVCEEVSLRDYHQACTRMARADYCGDGVPHTINGTLIDIGDKLTPRIQEFESDWDVEAEWNPDGAFCITDNLRALMLQEEDDLPSCFDDIAKKKNCGTMKKNRSLMTTRFELTSEYDDDDDDDNDDD